MSKRVDPKTTFPNTHRKFRPATEISRKCPIVCGGLELNEFVSFYYFSFPNSFRYLLSQITENLDEWAELVEFKFLFHESLLATHTFVVVCI